VRAKSRLPLNVRPEPADTSVGMNIETGSFRTRTTDDGSLEVWARGWRLESQLYALIPMGIALMFLLAPMDLPMRIGGAAVMLVATLFVFRMTKPGLWLTPEDVSVVSVIRTQRFAWERVSGFMGERRHDEARLLMVLDDQRQIPLPGTLDPEELDPYGDEGQMLSAADQLNQLREVAVAGDLPKPAPAPVVHAPTQASHAPMQASGYDDIEGGSKKDQRRERKELRAALKAVRLVPAGTDVAVAPPEEVPDRPRRMRRRSRSEAAPELVEVAIAEPEPVAARRRADPAKAADIPSYYPTPVYIPQAEYAQMLRDQKAAEKAAAAAAAELTRLAELDVPDELAETVEFSDRTGSLAD